MRSHRNPVSPERWNMKMYLSLFHVFRWDRDKLTCNAFAAHSDIKKSIQRTSNSSDRRNYTFQNANYCEWLTFYYENIVDPCVTFKLLEVYHVFMFNVRMHFKYLNMGVTDFCSIEYWYCDCVSNAADCNYYYYLWSSLITEVDPTASIDQHVRVFWLLISRSFYLEACCMQSERTKYTGSQNEAFIVRQKSPVVVFKCIGRRKKHTNKCFRLSSTRFSSYFIR